MSGLSPLAGMFASKIDDPDRTKRRASRVATPTAHRPRRLIEYDGRSARSPAVVDGVTRRRRLRDLVVQLRQGPRPMHSITTLILRIGGRLDPDRARPKNCAPRSRGQQGRQAGCGAKHETPRRRRVSHRERVRALGLAPLGESRSPDPHATASPCEGLLDRVGAPRTTHVGAFKGAAEPRRASSVGRDDGDARLIVERRFATQADAIGRARGLEMRPRFAAIDKGLFVEQDALSAKLVDEIATWQVFRDHARGDSEWRTLRRGPSVADFATLQRFLGMLPPDRPSEPHVALVYAVGNIVDGAGSGLVGAREEIASRTRVAALDQIAADDAVKTVVLRANRRWQCARLRAIWHAARRSRRKHSSCRWARSRPRAVYFAPAARSTPATTR